jgi:heme exporter protein C
VKPSTTTNWARSAAAIGVAALLAHLFLVFGFTPDDDLMGFVQKIMYLHVPSIWVTYLAFFIVFACSIAYLWKRDGAFDRVARSSAELGVLFCGVALATGAIWGRPTWGTYWVWDARLTTTLLLFLIFVGYLLLRAYSPPGERQARTAAVIAIVGFLDIPLIHVSVEWWRTLHQPSTLFKLGAEGAPKPALPAQLLWPLITGLAALTIVYAALMLYRVGLAEREEKLALRLAGE